PLLRSGYLLRSGFRLRVRLYERRFGDGESASAWRPYLCLLWQSILRSVLLFVHTTKHHVPLQDGYFRQWQSSVLPVPGAAVGLLQCPVAFCRRINRSRGTARRWLTAPSESASPLMTVRMS